MSTSHTSTPGNPAPIPREFSRTESAEDRPAAPIWFTDAIESAPEQTTVVVDDAAITYRAWGDPADRGVLLVHGGAAHAGWWDHIAPVLAADGYRVIAPHLSGHGDSEWRAEYRIGDWAREIVGVARAAGIADDMLVVGHSLGGIITMRAAEEFPDVVDDIVVIDSELFDDSDIEAMRTSDFRPISHRIRHYSSRAEALSRFRLVPDHDCLPYARAYVAAESLTEDPEGWRWKFDRNFAALLVDPAVLPPMHCRLTVVRAGRGRMTERMAQWLLAGRPADRVRLAVIEEAGHHVMLDHPLRLLEEIRTTLQGR